MPSCDSIRDMRPSKSRGGPAKLKLKPKRTPKTVDEYLASVPENSRAAFTKLRAAVRSAVPSQAAETISYGIPAFKEGKVLVWFAAFARHCSLFPTAAVIAEFQEELKDFSTSKGTVLFPNDKPLPIALIKKLVKARAAQAADKR